MFFADSHEMDWNGMIEMPLSPFISFLAMAHHNIGNFRNLGNFVHQNAVLLGKDFCWNQCPSLGGAWVAHRSFPVQYTCCAWMDPISWVYPIYQEKMTILKLKFPAVDISWYYACFRWFDVFGASKKHVAGLWHTRNKRIKSPLTKDIQSNPPLSSR